MEQYHPSDDCRRFYGSLPPQGVPYLAATIANMLAQVLPPSQMLLLGNFLSLLTSSLFAMANLQVIDDIQQPPKNPRTNSDPPAEEYGPID